MGMAIQRHDLDHPEQDPSVRRRLARELQAAGVRVADVGGRLFIGRREVRLAERAARAMERRDRRAAVRADREAERGQR